MKPNVIAGKLNDGPVLNCNRMMYIVSDKSLRWKTVFMCFSIVCSSINGNSWRW